MVLKYTKKFTFWQRCQLHFNFSIKLLNFLTFLKFENFYKWQYEWQYRSIRIDDMSNVKTIYAKFSQHFDECYHMSKKQYTFGATLHAIIDFLNFIAFFNLTIFLLMHIDTLINSYLRYTKMYAEYLDIKWFEIQYIRNICRSNVDVLQIQTDFKINTCFIYCKILWNI